MPKMTADKKIAFVIAGCSGAGKSTLLKKALKNNIPIFGKEWNELFQAINPERLPETSLFEKALSTRLFQAKHLPKLLKISELPNCFVVHLDLLNTLMHLINDPVFREDLPADLSPIQGRSMEDLLNKERNRQIFYYYIKKSFSRCDCVIVNTLYTPYWQNLRRWNFRADNLKHLKRSANSFHNLFDVKKPRPDIHKAIYTAWFEALEALNCDHVYVSRTEKILLRSKKFDLVPDSFSAFRFEAARPILKD